MSSMGLMVAPKMLLVRRMRRHANARFLESTQQSPQRESVELVTSTEGDQVVADANPDTAALPVSNGPRIQIVTFD